MSKSILIIDTPRDCCECPFGTIVFGKGVCFLDEGNGIECPLKPYKDFIPVELIKEWYKTHVYYLKEEKPIIYAYEQMIMDWEKENEYKESN